MYHLIGFVLCCSRARRVPNAFYVHATADHTAVRSRREFNGELECSPAQRKRCAFDTCATIQSSKLQTRQQRTSKCASTSPAANWLAIWLTERLWNKNHLTNLYSSCTQRRRSRCRAVQLMRLAADFTATAAPRFL